jgi:hypothetical protein
MRSATPDEQGTNGAREGTNVPVRSAGYGSVYSAL